VTLADETLAEALSELAHVEVLRVQPGDMVVITHPGPLTMEQASYIKRAVQARLPLPDVPVLVLSDGLTVSVARVEDTVCGGLDSFNPPPPVPTAASIEEQPPTDFDG